MKKKKKRRNEEKAIRKRLDKDAEQPIASGHVNKGLVHVLTLKVDSLQKILIHYYGENKTAMKKLRRPQLLSLVKEKMN